MKSSTLWQKLLFDLVKTPMLLVTINISGGGADKTCHLDSFHYEIWLFLPDPFLRVCIVIGRLTPRQVLVNSREVATTTPHAK